jgi:hypothetical protein
MKAVPVTGTVFHCGEMKSLVKGAFRAQKEEAL